MIKLHDLIAFLQEAEKTHRNIDCEIALHGPENSLYSSRLPDKVTLEPDEEHGDWLQIRFRAE